MQQDTDGGRTALGVELLAQAVEHVAALGLVGGVHVVKHSPAAVRLNLADDLLHVGHRRTTIEVDAGDVHSCFRECDRSRSAEAG